MFSLGIQHLIWLSRLTHLPLSALSALDHEGWLPCFQHLFYFVIVVQGSHHIDTHNSLHTICKHMAEVNTGLFSFRRHAWEWRWGCWATDQHQDLQILTWHGSLHNSPRYYWPAQVLNSRNPYLSQIAEVVWCSPDGQVAYLTPTFFTSSTAATSGRKRTTHKLSASWSLLLGTFWKSSLYLFHLNVSAPSKRV